MSDKEIIEEFYNQYFRTPKHREYLACGGKKTLDSYCRYLRSLGYPSCCGRGTYSVEVVDGEEVVFIGTPKDVAEELGITSKGVHNAIKYKSTTRTGYKLRIKPFKGHL